MTMENTTRKVIKGLGLYFYKLAEQSSDIFWVRGPDLRAQLYVSDSFDSIWKQSKDALYDDPGIWLRSLYPEDLPAVLAHWRQCTTATPDTPPLEYTFRINDSLGETHTLVDTVFPIFHAGELVGIAGISKRIDPAERGALSLSKYKKLLSLHEEEGLGAYWLKDKNAKFTYLSDSGEQLWGAPTATNSNSLQSDNWQKHIHPEDKERLSAESLIKRIKSSKKEHLELIYRVLKPDSSISWLRDHCTPLTNKAGDFTGFAGHTEVITSKVQDKKALAQAKQQAETADKAKSDFLAMVSHELRTPLNAILGMGQILAGSNLSKQQSDQLDVILASGKSLLSSVGDLLDYAKIDLGSVKFNLEPTEIRQHITNIIDEFKAEQLAPASLEFLLHIDSDVPQELELDRNKISQILTNLLINAFRFTDTGSIAVKLKCLQKNKSEAVICLTVEDSGSGIQKTELSNILNEFSDRKSVFTRQKDCLGLGLVIVRELVERMGGSLAVSSDPGSGSQFSCIIPMPRGNTKKHTTAKRLPPAQILTALRPCFNLNILVVEDNPINQKIIRIMLEQLGCRVTIASSGLLALEMVNKEFDIIFMDIGLPDIDGFETTRRILASNKCAKNVPIIAMTAHVFNQDRERCFQVGMDEVIAKPILEEGLIAMLHRWAKPVAV